MHHANPVDHLRPNAPAEPSLPMIAVRRLGALMMRHWQHASRVLCVGNAFVH